MNLQQVRRPASGAVVLMLFFASFSLWAQQPSKPSTPPPASTPQPSSTTLSVNARLVNIPVVVRDKKGAFVQNLTKDDFTLKVDNKQQTIKYFDRDTNLPLILGLLVDTSLSQRNVIDEERTASSAFLDQMLTSPHDQAFVAEFARQTELLQDLTSSHPLLQKALKEIDTPSQGSVSSTNPDDNDTDSAGRRIRGGTVLYDALFLTSDEIMSKPTGRKAIIILSDGVDRNSKETLTRAIEAAQRADTVIYAIYFKGQEQSQNNFPRHGGYPGGGYPGGGYPGRYPGGGYPGGGYPGGGGNGGNRPTGGGASNVDGKRILDQIAGETGGRVFEAKKNKDFAPIFQQIADELRAQYRLGYTPTDDTASSGYHQVDLTVNQKEKGLEVQTRNGYYAK